MTEHNGEQAGFGGGQASSEEQNVQASAQQAQPQHPAASPGTPDPAASNPTESIPAPNPTAPLNHPQANDWQNQRREGAGGPTPVAGPTQPGQPGPQYPGGQQGQQYPGQHAYGQPQGQAQGHGQYQGPTQPLAQQYQGQPQAGAPQYGAHASNQSQPSAPQYGGHSQSRPSAPQYGAHSQSEAQSGAPQSPEPRYGQYAQTAYGTPVPPSDAAGQGVPQQARRREKKKVGAGIFVAGMVAAALVGGGAAAGTTALLDGSTQSSTVQNAPAAAPLIVNNKDNVNAVTAAAQKASPSVVTISATSGNSGGTGSGIILDTDGHILTNTHVVTLDGQAANATIEVRTNDGKVYPGKVVGTDPLSDLAVIKIDAQGLVPATLGDSDKINVGDTVIAIGAPLGLSGTVTDGIVSTLNRTIQVSSSAVPKSESDSSGGQGNGQGNGGNGFNFAPPDGSSGSSNAAQGTVNLNVIQTDASINPGNSGGALTNTQGEIIGVNVAIASAGSSSSSSSQSGSIGVGFSIPIDNAKRIAQEIIKNGSATHGQLGVSVKDQAAGANADSSSFSVGAQVASVTPGSAADKAGLKVGDVITNLGSRTITDGSELTAAVREQAAGATVKVTYTRGNSQHSADVTLDAAPTS